jgi:hypothetical protein
MASVSARSRPVMCSTPPLDHRLRRRRCWCARDVGDLGCTRWHSGAGLRTRVGSMVDTLGAISVTCLLQPISATDLSGELMATGPRDLHARCVRFDSLPQPSHRDADDRAPGAVVGSNECTLVGHSQALRASELADGVRRRSGSRT